MYIVYVSCCRGTAISLLGEYLILVASRNDPICRVGCVKLYKDNVSLKLQARDSCHCVQDYTAEQ